MLSRIARVREQERLYHEHCFEENRLFQKGSWLEEPTEIVLQYAEEVTKAAEASGSGPLYFLDLGSGVGRNSIPLADMLKNSEGGQVVCVDLLEKALDQLSEYSEAYQVADYIKAEQADISDYPIPARQYNYIVAASSLEHVRSEELLDRVLSRMREGTAAGGINCIVMHTSIAEYEARTGEKRETFFEVTMDPDAALAKLRQCYAGWEELHAKMEPQELEINRGDTPVILKATSLTYVVQRPGNKTG
ncbi:class I SAM-dependent methyltransferase [Paenibacillus sambharensis]|uniref:Class I SAM-dependent methyltransferase n=1 Tax=Paenibacillus sambharensis TaxID=1803190 RepID=A0A2W1LMF7_9BACL|nr:class I SAM-dependent methyltransferase [Paenibacillus sambharensis]PZD96065.1 class I SAM-dependent methyltransferase [Paenibacillus sambharensis]